MDEPRIQALRLRRNSVPVASPQDITPNIPPSPTPTASHSTPPHQPLLLLNLEAPSPLEIVLARLRPLHLLMPTLPILVATPAVVKVTNLAAVKQRLVQPRVDNVVHLARPPGRRAAGARLRRVFLDDLLKVRRALAAGVEAREELDERLERQPLLVRRLVGEARHGRVYQLPGCAAELGSAGGSVS